MLVELVGRWHDVDHLLHGLPGALRANASLGHPAAALLLPEGPSPTPLDPLTLPAGCAARLLSDLGRYRRLMLFCRALRHRRDFGRVRDELESVGRGSVGYFTAAAAAAGGGGGGCGENETASTSSAPTSSASTSASSSPPPSIQILSSKPAAGLLHPAYVLLADAGTQSLVLVIRGTTGFRDAVTVLSTKAATKRRRRVSRKRGDEAGGADDKGLGRPPSPSLAALSQAPSSSSDSQSKSESSEESEGEEEEVHEGLAAAAEALAAEVGPALAGAAAGRPGWRVLLTGHSAGGGAAALLALHLRTEAREIASAAAAGEAAGAGAEVVAGGGASATAAATAEGALASATAVAFACPPVASLALARSLAPFVTTVLCGADVVPTLSTHALDSLRADALEIAERKKRQRLRQQRQTTTERSPASTSAAAKADFSLSLSGALPPLPSFFALGSSSSSFVQGVIGAALGAKAKVFAACLLGALGFAAAAALGAAAAVASALRSLVAAARDDEEERREQRKRTRQLKEQARASGFKSNIVPWPPAQTQKGGSTRGGGAERKGSFSLAATTATRTTATNSATTAKATRTTTTNTARAAIFPPGRILHLVPAEVLAASADDAINEKKQRESHGESDCGCGGEAKKENEEAAALLSLAPSPTPQPPSSTVILAAVPHERYARIRPHPRMLRDHFIPAHLEALDAAAAAFVASAVARAEEEANLATVSIASATTAGSG